jgi:hypothetical protein
METGNPKSLSISSPKAKNHSRQSRNLVPGPLKRYGVSGSEGFNRLESQAG